MVRSDGEIRIAVSSDTITSGLAELERRGKDMRPVMETIGDLLISNIEENFAQEGRFSESGVPGSWRGGTNRWQDLAPSTVKRRGSAHPILHQSGMLAATLGKDVNDTSVVVGVGGPSVKYAHIQNFGGMAGRGRKVKVPSRPYMTVAEETVTEIHDTLGDYLTK